MDQERYEEFQMNESLQGQQIAGQLAPYAPQMQQQVQEAQAVIIEQTNPSKIVSEIVLRLRGLARQNGKLVRISQPKVNKEGADNIWFILDSHINQNVTFSSLTNSDINKIMDGLQNDIVDDLTLNQKSYGIRKKTDLDTINNSILYNIFMCLKRAEDRNEKNFLKGITMENVSGGSSNFRPKQEGWLSKFKL